MRTTKVKNKLEWRQYLPVLFMMLIGAACGYYIVEYIDGLAEAEKSNSEIVLSAAGLFVGMYLAIFVQIILHEAGHLLFGRMTGYRFSSFRIGSFMWIKDGGTIRYCRLKLAGTGGQCLMAPPESQDGKIPYILYNMGGSITNSLSAALFVGIALLTKNITVVSALFIMLAVVGAVFTLMNGVPMRLGTINNDGYNAVSLGKDLEALRSFWIQLKSNELGAKGIRIKDMPEEWLEMPSPESMKNSMVAVLSVFVCNRMMDKMEFEKASKTIRELLQMDTGIVGLHRNLITADLIYCELVGENRREKLTEMLDKKQKKL